MSRPLLFIRSLLLALPEESAQARQRKVSLKQMSGQPLIIFPRKLAPAFHDKIVGRFLDAGLTPRIGQGRTAGCQQAGNGDQDFAHYRISPSIWGSGVPP